MISETVTGPARRSDRRRLRAISAKKSKVCRALFGEVDHEEIQRDLEREMAILTKADEQRWNFDFVSEYRFALLII